MFCPECGKQLPDGTKFCGNCGNRLEAPAAQQVPCGNYSTEQVSTAKPKVKVTDGSLHGLKNRGVCFFLSLLAMILGRCFAMREHIQAYMCVKPPTAEMFIEETDTVSIFADSVEVNTISVLLFVFALALVLLPLVTGGRWKKWNQLPVVVVSFLHVAWMLIVFSVTNNETSGYGTLLKFRIPMWFANISFTFDGIVLMVLNLAAGVLMMIAMAGNDKRVAKSA